MSDLILHHYAMSPFSEKVRAMLGYADLPWQSVITREMPPRPQLAELAGGYRKIPVAQSGADIFCDSRIIATEIAALARTPELVLENCSAEVQAYVQEVDLDLFFACLIAGGTAALSRKVRDAMSLADIARFFWDRINLGRTASVKASSLRGAKPRVLQHLARVEALLTQDFIFGAKPCHADFSTYHSLWFMRDLGESPLLDAFPKTLAWMDRIKAMGHGQRHEISAEQAHEIAKAATARAIPEEHRRDALIGRKVSISPSDYGKNATAGILVGATPVRWILARESQALGTLHVHFPKQGFKLKTV